MNDFNELEVSTQLVIQAGIKRGFKVDIISVRNNYIRIWWNNDNYIDVIEATITKYSNLICFWKTENKDITKNILIEHGFPCPKFKLFNVDDEIRNFDELNYPLVVKPTNTNFGDHVSLNLTNASSVQNCIALCLAVAKTVIVEEQQPGDDYRFLVIKNRVVAVAKRTPPSITGNGKSTIMMLINELNHHRIVHCSPIYKNITIDSELILKLNEQALTLETVLKAGQRLNLGTLPNISKGGECCNVTNDIPPFYLNEIARLSHLFENDILGIDVIINDLKKDPDKKEYAVIEVNDCPMISLHKYPSEGEGVDIEEFVLNYYIDSESKRN